MPSPTRWVVHHTCDGVEAHRQHRQQRSGSSVGRLSLCGHHAPSTYPEVGALGFNRSRGVFAGPAWRRPLTARPSCVHSTIPSRPHTTQSFESATTRSRWVRATYRRHHRHYAHIGLNGARASPAETTLSGYLFSTCENCCASALLGARHVNGRRCTLSVEPFGCPLLLQSLTGLLAHRLPGRFISHH